MNKPLPLILAGLIFVCAAHVSTMAQAEPLVSEWVNDDIKGVLSVVQLIPFEKQNLEKVKASLQKDWGVEETDLGFGAKYLELEKGQGYTKGYIYALIYDGRVAQYEAGIESHSEAWPRISQRINDKWKESNGPEVPMEEHGLAFRRTLANVLHDYRARVAVALGPLNDAEVPKELIKSYVTLTDPMENSTISGTHQNDEIQALLTSQRIDLLENVLRAYNPGARVLAALALLELEKSGRQLSSKTRLTANKVLHLRIGLHACFYDMCSTLTARELLQWFDSGLAFPKPKAMIPRRKP